MPFVAIDNPSSRVTAWNSDGSEPQLPAGSVLIEVTQAQFNTLRTLSSGQVYLRDGSFIAEVAPSGDGYKALIERRARALDRIGTVEAQLAAINLRMGV